MDTRLAGEVIVVTGGSAGLGRAMAEAFVREGANVVCAARNENRLSQTVSGISATGPGDATGVPTNVRSRDSIRNLFNEVDDIYGGVDTVVNNAGVSQSNLDTGHGIKPITDVPIDVWDAILETNLRGVFICVKEALPAMLSRENGCLIHISSGHGIQGKAKRAPYVASKFGLEGFAESLALELEDTGVDSMLLRPPGATYTERREELGRDRETFSYTNPAIVAEPAVQLAAGKGQNGGRYVATEDGEGYDEY